MIKFGVYKASQLLGRERTRFRKEPKNVSIALYDQLAELPNADELAERILRHFADSRGAYKRTYAQRFAEFDREAIRLMREEFDPDKPLVVEDVAVSDARTSCEFFAGVAPHFPRVSFTASDLNPEVFIVERGWTRIALDHESRLLEMAFPPFVFNVNKRDSYRHYPLNHLVRWIVERAFVRPLMRRRAAGRIDARRLLVFAPQALALAEKDPRFRLERRDLLSTPESDEQADVIRAMNVLNPSYFREAEIQTVLSNLHARLRDGGWLITGSNEEANSLVHGGIYRRAETGFRLQWKSGDGSPIEQRILDFNKT